MATVTIERSDLDRLTEFTRNTNWLLENIEELRTKYPDRYVAVLDSGDEVLDAQTIEELTEKIRQRAGDPETCAIEFLTRERYLLLL